MKLDYDVMRRREIEMRYLDRLSLEQELARVAALGEVLRAPPTVLCEASHPALAPAEGDEHRNRCSCARCGPRWAFGAVVPKESCYLIGPVIASTLTDGAVVDFEVGCMYRSVIDARYESLTHVIVPPRQNFGVRVTVRTPQEPGLVLIYGWDIGGPDRRELRAALAPSRFR